MLAPEQVPVVIVGGGLAGLTTACLLATYNVKSILLEKHLESSPHPRAVGFTIRTMEIFDTIGIADKIPQIPADFRLRRIQVESLAGKWHAELGKGHHGKPQQPTIELSPFSGAAIAQDKLEGILRQRAQELGCDLRFGHRMLSFNRRGGDEAAVMVSVRDTSLAEYTISARFFIAADGHKSPVRTALNISTSGRGHLKTVTSVLFQAPSLDAYLSKGFQQFVINRPEANLEAFLTTYGDGRWVLMFSDEKTRAEIELQEGILQATGIPDLNYKIVATGIWDLQARIADTFAYPSSGDASPTIFLLGDAAHTLPPTRGGYGANTGIGDAHNLAWKIAAVISGESTAELLKTYDFERRRTAWLRHDQTFARPDYAAYRKDGEDYGPVRDDDAMELGQIHHSPGVVEDEEDGAGVEVMSPDKLKGRPGSRAPHLWLLKADDRISSLTLFAKQWSIVTTEPRWKRPVQMVGQEVGLPLRVLCIGQDGLKEEDGGDIADNHGLAGGAASLVRPDGIITWRSGQWSDEGSAYQSLAAAVQQAASARHAE